LGNKAVTYGQNCFIEMDDAKDIVEGEKVTLMKWGNCTIHKRVEEGGKVTLYGKIDEADQDFKKTKKLTWLCNDPNTMVEVNIVEYAHLINKQKVEDGDKVEDLVNRNSKAVSVAYAEGSVKNINKSSIIQFERRGYYIVDKVGLQNNLAAFVFIPDGKASAMSKVQGQINAAEMQKGKGEAKKKQGKQEPAAGAEEGKLSKKEQNKLAKAAKKADAKEAKKSGGDQKPAEQKQQQAAPQKNNDLEKAEIQLQKTQWMGGDLPSQADYLLFLSLDGKVPSPVEHPYVFGWYNFAAKFVEQIKQSWPAQSAQGDDKKGKKEDKKKDQPKKEAKKEEKKKEEPKKEAKPAEEDDFDPFADEEEEDEEAEKAKMARMKEIAKTAKSYGKVVVAKSLIIFEVKPWGEETDLDVLAKKILGIEMDGLFWKTEYKKEPIAYGVFKIVIGATVEDDKVSTDEL